MEWNKGPVRKSASIMIIVLVAVISAASAGEVRTSEMYSWETQHAKPTPSGDLEWTPEPFMFKVGSSLRYIDFEKGRDSNSGTSKDSAW